MKLPSIQELSGKALSTFRRFPLVMLTAFVGTVLMIIFVESNSIKFGTELFFNWQKTILLFALAIPLLVSLSLYFMRNSLKLTYKISAYLILILILFGYFFLFENQQSDIIRYILYSISAYLLVIYSAYIGVDNENSFWEFNKLLLFRLINSGIFSILLYLGLALAVAAIGELFKVKWNNEIYLDIFVVIIGIFNTWYFLSGVPDDFSSVDTIVYPKLLKLFSQYILIPLSIVYLIILYAYSIKIIYQWQLPIGWTSSLIIAYSGIGILAYVLLFPLTNDKNNKWAIIFSNLFFKFLFPLIVLMSLAVMQRISDYGITEPRYFLIILTIWLLASAVYYTFSKRKNIKFIPVSFFIILSTISIGPWGAFSISENSQINRVMHILNTHKIIAEGKVSEETQLKKKDYDNLVSTLYYLETFHNFNNLIAELKSKSDFSMSTKIASMHTKDILNILSVINKENEIDPGDYEFDISSFTINPINIEDYNSIVKLDKRSLNSTIDFETEIKDQTISIMMYRNNKELRISRVDDDSEKIVINLVNLLNKLADLDSSDISSDDFVVIAEISRLKVLLYVNSISAYLEGEKSVLIDKIKGDIYIQIK